MLKIGRTSRVAWMLSWRFEVGCLQATAQELPLRLLLAWMLVEIGHCGAPARGAAPVRWAGVKWRAGRGVQLGTDDDSTSAVDSPPPSSVCD